VNILPLRNRVETTNSWLRQRLETVLPEVMRREGFDMWIVNAREYAEDPVMMTFLPGPMISAGRRTILVFSLGSDGTFERLSLSRYSSGDYYRSVWQPDTEDQYACLVRIIRERKPKTIGINLSENFAFGDGLSHTDCLRLRSELGPELSSCFQSAERLAVGWLERRTEPEIIAYPRIVGIGHELIAHAFSSRVIHPGITTTEDVAWWIRQTIQDLGLSAWFQPTVDIQSAGTGYSSFTSIRDGGGARTVIMPGDLLHCDVGFHYLGLATDQQQNAYVLKPGEIDAPEGLKRALADGNRLQDILAAEMVAGRTGNEILHAARARAVEEGLKPSIYSHPIGYHGHAAGPTIGLWDRQEGVAGNGDYELFDDTCYSIELNVRRDVPEWDNQEVRIGLEEDAVFSNGALRWLDGRQERLILIGGGV
jgi:hypothetical protein